MEAEWEFACRAGNQAAWYGKPDSIAWFYDNSGDVPHPVCQKQPNDWGFYDLLGNVWELCQDWYDAGYYQAELAVDPIGAPSGTHRVIRGGSWFNDPSQCRSAYRDEIHPASYYNNFGFRVGRVS